MAVTCSQYSRFQRILYQRYSRDRVMQRKRIIVACISLLLVGLALPANITPRAHAFHASDSATISGFALRGYNDPTLTGSQTIDIAASGATINFNVVLFADNPTNAYQRNATVGVKFDWTTAYQNASNAGPSNTLTMTANQDSSVTLSLSVLSTTGMIPHTCNLLIGAGPQNKHIPSSCSANINGAGNVCLISGGAPFEIWTNDQISAAQAKFQASQQITNVGVALATIRAISLSGTTPALTNAAGQLT